MAGVVNPIDMPHSSASSIEAATRCGKAYQLQRVVKVPTTPSYALLGGSAVHAATEALDRMAISTGG